MYIPVKPSPQSGQWLHLSPTSFLGDTALRLLAFNASGKHHVQGVGLAHLKGAMASILVC